jgi:hypothetical protein
MEIMKHLLNDGWNAWELKGGNMPKTSQLKLFIGFIIQKIICVKLHMKSFNNEKKKNK